MAVPGIRAQSDWALARLRNKERLQLETIPTSRTDAYCISRSAINSAHRLVRLRRRLSWLRCELRQGLAQNRYADRLGQNQIAPRRLTIGGFQDVPEAGDEDHGHRRCQRLDQSGELTAIQAGHGLVGQDDVAVTGLELFQPLVSVRRGLDPVTIAGEV